MRTLLVAFVLAMVLVPSLPAEEDAWAIHAQTDLSTQSDRGLSEVYLPLSLEQTPSVSENEVQWTWWSWSAQTGSDWPDDDALYRASNRNISLDSTSNEVVAEHHAPSDVDAVALSGKVKVVSAEDRVRMVAFDISITPLENLSNHTILYVVLTENIAEDQHRRQAENLVREMRPEVAFSVKANTTTDLVSMYLLTTSLLRAWTWQKTRRVGPIQWPCLEAKRTTTLSHVCWLLHTVIYPRHQFTPVLNKPGHLCCCLPSLRSSPSPSSSPSASGNKPFQNSRPAGAVKIPPQPPSSFRPVSMISGLRVGRSVLLGNSKVVHRNEASLQVIQKPSKLSFESQESKIVTLK